MKSFNKIWENKIYSRGRCLNNYPYDLVVSLVVKNFFSLSWRERKKINMLDLGCGAGNHAKFLAENGFTVYGLDGSGTAVKHCRRKFKNLGLKANFIRGDFLNLPYADKFFDCVLDRESIYANKFTVIKKALEQVYRKLKIGGLFISFMYSDHHPEMKSGRRRELNTYDNFKSGSMFHDSGTAHFTNLKEIKILFSGFKIKNIVRHTIKEVYNRNNPFQQYDEYVIIAKK